LRREERRAGIQIEYLVEMGFGDLLKADRFDLAGIRYDNAEPALFFTDRLKETIKVCGAGRIALNGLLATLMTMDFTRGGLE
jgi:hypothetical protein